MNEQQQGVAQRAMSEVQSQIGHFGTESEHIAAVRYGAMRLLHDELSAEARRVLAGYRHDPDFCAEIVDIFDRLGLDIDGEAES